MCIYGVCIHTYVQESNNTSKSYVRFLQLTSYEDANYEEFKSFTNKTAKGFFFLSGSNNERLGWSL